MTRASPKSIQKDTEKKSRFHKAPPGPSGRKNKEGKRLLFDHQKIEPKWQNIWLKTKIYSPNLDRAEKPYYNLMMFPYPSAEGLHVGNMYAFTGSDIFGRFKRMQRFSVFEPIGLDGFGIHSENYALKIGKHPRDVAKKTQKRFYSQLHQTGNAYDWDRTLETYDPAYYKWTQWIFVNLFKSGLAYRAKAPVNWCPSCKTVLSDEQVLGAGECERCGTKVEVKELEQWFFRIQSGVRPDGTPYPESLLKNLETLDWTHKIKIIQKNWIGRSEGADIGFKIYDSKDVITVFTTRPDTLFGATFLAISAQSPVVNKLTVQAQRGEVEEFLKKIGSQPQDRSDTKDKTGFFTGSYAVNPGTGEKIPIWVADYVLGAYAGGAIMGVPAHDRRDFEFAQKYNLPIKQVVARGQEVPFEGDGVLFNSQDWNGLDTKRDLSKILSWIEKKKIGRGSVSYHLRDWAISRQRYWGPPIPMIYCKHCASEGRSWFSENKMANDKWQIANADWAAGWYPVPEDELPVELPFIKDFQPKGTGKAPLANHPEFYEVSCPKCGSKARRETDVSDNFLDSAWYYLGYLILGGGKKQKDENLELEFRDSLAKRRAWLPVDTYVGGAEHAVLHLMYTRWLSLVFSDLGLIDWEEPFKKFYAHGLLISEGTKMSKSRGNVVVPDEYIKKFGADALRCYLMFLGPFSEGGDFRDAGIEGMKRFVNRVARLYEEHRNVVLTKEDDNKEVLVKMHQTIKKVTEDIENFRYNTAISAIMEFVNVLREKAKSSPSPLRRSLSRAKSRGSGLRRAGKIRCAEWDEALATLVKLLAPFAPHITEEIWQRYYADSKQFNSIHTSDWPKYDADLARKREIVIVVQVDGRFRQQLTVNSQQSTVQTEIVKMARNDPKVIKHINGKKIKRTVFVPGKLINFVT